MIITIDGPSGTGKSTVAKRLAEQLGFSYFDTGAMYRAVTYGLLKQSISFEDTQKIEQFLGSFTFTIRQLDGAKQYFSGDEEVTKPIRSQKVTYHVSEVAALDIVRQSLVAIQRRFAEGIDAVFEGRDLGTVVFPQANVKIFLNASPEVRAERRHRELLATQGSKEPVLNREEVRESLARRDEKVSTRAHSPLRQAGDAYFLDTSGLTVEQVVAAAISKIELKTKQGPQ